MLYLLCGSDHQSKNQKILAIKEKIFSSSRSSVFDSETLYASGLDLKTLKKAMIALPSLTRQRLLVIRQADKLTAAHQDLIAQCLESTKEFLVLILDAEDGLSAQQLQKKFGDNIKTLYSEEKQEVSVFDLEKAILHQEKALALRTLSEILKRETLPVRSAAPKLIGGLLWIWKKNKNRLSSHRFRGGLVLLQEADFHIKRSRLKPEHALEILLIKLCS